jgi:hypothetical protein
MLALFGMETLPESADSRYPKLQGLAVAGVELILLSTEPYRFGEQHRNDLQQQLSLPVHVVDGEMTSWYGSRAIAGLNYLRKFAMAL